jgi:hypothetical protein
MGRVIFQITGQPDFHDRAFRYLSRCVGCGVKR